MDVMSNLLECWFFIGLARCLVRRRRHPLCLDHP
jgi:hypothetical protein